MTKLFQKKGFGIIGVIILVAFAFAALNVYTYFNPTFSLAKYSLVNLLNQQRDKQRISDLKTLEAAIVKYYDANNQVPTTDGWCGRISDILHSEFSTAIKPYLSFMPTDPSYSKTSEDYFYYRVNSNRYILMAVLDNPPAQSADTTYNFVKCHDWPGDNVYNYQIRNF